MTDAAEPTNSSTPSPESSHLVNPGGGFTSHSSWPEAAVFGVDQIAQQAIQALRQITRAIDLDSRSLWHQFGLTAPQLAALLAIARGQPITAGRLAQQLHLGQPTVSGILDRLERRAFVQRERGEQDRRSVLLRLTPAGQEVLNGAPSLLHGFCQQLAALEAWERTQILSSLQRVATMMERSERSCLPPVAEVLNEQRPVVAGPPARVDASEPIVVGRPAPS